MREPKYRAFILGKMYEVQGMAWGEDGITVFTAGGFMHLCEEEEIELLEFTGLKDKNGVEIYEGDIVRNPDNYPTLKVFYNCDENRAEWAGLCCDDMVLGWFEASECEVIGNIWENRELLKEGINEN